MSEQENKKTGNKLVDAILHILKLDDKGKTETFINKTIKHLNRDVDTYKRSIANIKHNYDGKMSLLEEELEDLQANIEDSYTNITMGDISNNEVSNTFRVIYLSNIRGAELAVEKKEEEIKYCKKVYEADVKATEDKIALRKVRIEKLKGN